VSSRKLNDKLRIAVDMDDVVCDFTSRYLASMEIEFGVTILKSDITTWDNNPMKVFPWKDYGFKSWWGWLEKRDWIWGLADAVPGALAGLQALRHDGHYVEIVTSKPEWAEAQVWKWMGRWRPPVDAVIITDLESPKYLVSDADVLVDDKPDNVLGWAKSGKDRLAILFDQPWNQDMNTQEQENTLRAYTWQDVVRIVRTAEEVGTL